MRHDAKGEREGSVGHAGLINDIIGKEHKYNIWNVEDRWQHGTESVQENESRADVVAFAELETRQRRRITPEQRLILRSCPLH